MKIKRSTKCTLKFTNKNKLNQLDEILTEYGKVVNFFIDTFWGNRPSKVELLSNIVNLPETWLSARLRKVAAREAIDIIKSATDRKDDKLPVKPKHRGNRMQVSSTIAGLSEAKKSTEYDLWLHLSSIGNKVILNLPLKKHAHFIQLSNRGKRLESYIITRDYVQFCFEIITGDKKKPEACIGIDSGIKTLAATSDGRKIGGDIEEHINRVKRCKHGSKGQKRAARALRQRMDECAKEVTDNVSLVVVEKLKNITKNTKNTKNIKNTKKNPKRRLGKSMRRTVGKWNIRYWLGKVESNCQDKNVSFRTVSSYYTSQRCSFCGHTERGNRAGEVFLCRECGHTDNADINAARNILTRFLTGPYGAGCQEYTGVH